MTVKDKLVKYIIYMMIYLSDIFWEKVSLVLIQYKQHTKTRTKVDSHKHQALARS